MGRNRQVFAIFEGGGAKGIAHIGALKALEERNFELAGVAGTSAGALVATLAAVGYRADDMLNPEAASNNILTRFGFDPVRLLGSEQWRTLGRASRAADCFSKAFAAGGLLGAFLAAPRTSVVAWRVFNRHGFLSTARARELLNALLREKLRDLHAARGRRDRVPDRVTFADLDYLDLYEDGVRPLKLVATNLRTKALTVFDRVATPDVEVAEAVAASVAIPLVFEPVTVANCGDLGPYVDGGLVSNFPVWVFTEEKLALERANSTAPTVPVVGFTLVEPESAALTGAATTAAPRRTFVDHLRDLAAAAIFGSQAVSQRFISDLLVVPLRTSLDTLDFDAGWDRFREAYKDGQRCATERLMVRLVLVPEKVNDTLQKACWGIRRAIDRARADRGEPKLGVCRTNVMTRYGRESLRVTYAFNSTGDADDRLILDPRSKGAPEAFATREPVLLRSPDGALARHATFMTKYERAFVRPTLRSAICMPIFADLRAWRAPAADRGEPLGVFCFDSDDDLATDFAQDDIKRIVAQYAVLFAALLTEDAG